ncbi:MAG: MotA/TolQ/ExbB proton channel family protein [Gemmatimonadaceae bacterium]
MLLPSLVLQVGSAVPSTPLELITNASRLTQGVLVLLAILSLVSWGVMLAKWREFGGVRRQSRAFMQEFEKVRSFDQAVGLARRSRPSPFIRVFDRVTHFVGGPAAIPGNTPAYGTAAVGTSTLSGSQVEALRLVLDAETNTEREHLGRFIPTLAVIGSVSPLIGLLGTVLGVIEAFLGIATKGSGNIGAVAPGVAEALIATAAALAVAIPAVFGYNIFASRLNRIDSELEGFGSEIIAMMAREGRI